MGSDIAYKGRELLINIGKAKDNYNKNRKPKYFNYNIYKYIVKDYKKLNKEREIRKYYKCNKLGHLAKNCRLEQKKNRSIEEKLEDEDKEDNGKEAGFVKGLEQAQYNESLYIVILCGINMLFLNKNITKKYYNMLEL